MGDFVCDQRDTEIHHRSDSISMVFSPKFHSGSCIERGSTSCIQSCNDHHFRYHLPVNLNCTSHPPTSTVTASPLNERSNDLRLLFDPYKDGESLRRSSEASSRGRERIEDVGLDPT